MIFKKHTHDLYNILLTLSRNIFFYEKIKLSDNFETRLYLIFMHFSILIIIFRKKKNKFSQDIYDSIFHNIENDLRELGIGDVTVNKKMKEFNKIFYDILLKIEKDKQIKFEINYKLISRYFDLFDSENCSKFTEFKNYFNKFYGFCFGLPLNNMLSNLKNFKY